MIIKNLMTGSGFEGGAYSSPWIMAWVGLFVLAILIMLSKRWLEEEGIIGEYSFLGGLLGPLVYFLIIMFTGQAKWALLGGLVGMFAGGKGMARLSNG